MISNELTQLSKRIDERRFGNKEKEIYSQAPIFRGKTGKHHNCDHGHTDALPLGKNVHLLNEILSAKIICGAT